MSMRITTNGVFQGYRSNLASSYGRMTKSMTRVASQRTFSAYSEDVSAASRAFQLRRSHWRASTQVSNSNYVISKFETAWSSIDFIVDGEGTENNLNGIVESLKGLNGATASARVALGESLMGKSESVVRLMNIQYGDQFIFAGADGKNVPFSWGADGTLLYRDAEGKGIDVSTPVGLTQDEFDALTANEKTALAEKLEVSDLADFDAYKTAFNAKYSDFDNAYENGLTLKKWAEETMYVDIGLGIKWDDAGELIPSSAYNSALSGLNILGFGSTTDEDGHTYSNNLAVLMRDLGQVLKNCDGTTGDFPEPWNTDSVSALVGKIQDAVDAVSVQHVKLAGDVTYLITNLTQLETLRDNLNQQFMEIEQGDPADAINEFLYARYSYNAALSVGSSILTNTLLDYLR